jgi:formamidopyrimidine-DNA glycosylase
VPELAEVEYARRLAHQTCVGRKIVQVNSKEDPIVFDGVSPREWEVALEGARVQSVERYGKHFWMCLDTRPWPVFHFGMAGNLRTSTGGGLALVSSAHGESLEWPPKFAITSLTLDDGGVVVFTDKRRLGRLRLRRDPLREPPLVNLGFDPLLGLPSPESFHARLVARRAPLKSVLLDQGFAAGVGNWLADEMLFHARLSPHTIASTLETAESARLREAMKRVVETAVEMNADSASFPPHWLFHRRWGKPAGAKTENGLAIAFDVVAGRTTAWVPEVQEARRT